MKRNLKARIERLEAELCFGEIGFTLGGGVRIGIRRREILDAVLEAVFDVKSNRAHILLHAISASDNSRLHELAQALRAGPVERFY